MTTVGKLKCNVMPSGCRNYSLQMVIQSRFQLHKSTSGAKNAVVGVIKWAALPMGILQEKGGLTTQQKDNNLQKQVWEIAQTINVGNKLGAGPEQWYLLMDCWVTHISDLLSKRPLGKWSMADKTILDSRRFNAALAEYTEVGHPQWKHSIDETPTK